MKKLLLLAILPLFSYALSIKPLTWNYRHDGLGFNADVFNYTLPTFIPNIVENVAQLQSLQQFTTQPCYTLYVIKNTSTNAIVRTLYLGSGTHNLQSCMDIAYNYYIANIVSQFVIN